MTFWKMEWVFTEKLPIFERLTLGHYPYEIVHKNWVQKTRTPVDFHLEKVLKYSFETQNLSRKTTLSVRSPHQNCLSSIDPCWNIFLGVFDHGKLIGHRRDLFQPWESWLIWLGIFKSELFRLSISERVRCFWDSLAPFRQVFWYLQEISVLGMYDC